MAHYTVAMSITCDCGTVLTKENAKFIGTAKDFGLDMYNCPTCGTTRCVQVLDSDKLNSTIARLNTRIEEVPEKQKAGLKELRSVLIEESRAQNEPDRISSETNEE